jgi:hypothetical protein
VNGLSKHQIDQDRIHKGRKQDNQDDLEHYCYNRELHFPARCSQLSEVNDFKV